MIPRGMRDIKTHGTLAREGRLVNVARDLHELGGICFFFPLNFCAAKRAKVKIFS